MTLEELQTELMEAGYSVEIETLGIFGHFFPVLVFEDNSSIERIKISMNMRGWGVVELKCYEYEGGRVVRKKYVLERKKDTVELQDCLLGIEGTVVIYLLHKQYISKEEKW